MVTINRGNQRTWVGYNVKDYVTLGPPRSRSRCQYKRSRMRGLGESVKEKGKEDRDGRGVFRLQCRSVTCKGESKEGRLGRTCC